MKAGSSQSPSLTLRVVGNGGGGGNSSAGSSPAPGGSRAAPAPNTPDNAASADARYGFIQFAVPKKDFYVGEMVPVEIDALIPAQVQPTNYELPGLSGEGFALNQLSDKPQQNVRVVDGHQYRVFSWRSALTAVKPGDFP